MAWAVRGTSPPLCAAHGGGKRPVGAPKQNKNAQTHGLYSKDQEDENPDSLRAILDRLKRRLEKLERYLEDHWNDLEPADLVRVTHLQAETVSRISRIERDIKRMENETGSESMEDTLREAYLIAETILGIDLGEHQE